MGDFTATRLRKALAGKSLKLAPSINTYIFAEERNLLLNNTVFDAIMVFIMKKFESLIHKKRSLDI